MWKHLPPATQRHQEQQRHKLCFSAAAHSISNAAVTPIYVAVTFYFNSLGYLTTSLMGGQAFQSRHHPGDTIPLPRPYYAETALAFAWQCLPGKSNVSPGCCYTSFFFGTSGIFKEYFAAAAVITTTNHTQENSYTYAICCCLYFFFLV